MRILIADDHDLVSELLGLYIKAMDADAVVETVPSFQRAVASVQANPRFDVILLDLNMPGMQGLTGLSRMREMVPSVPVVVISGAARLTEMRAAMKTGAAGFFPKTMNGDAFASALKLVLAGRRYIPDDLLESGEAKDAGEELLSDQPLTAREREVFEQLLAGKSNREIGETLRISEITVKIHLQHIYRKIGAKNRGDAIRIGMTARPA